MLDVFDFRYIENILIIEYRIYYVTLIIIYMYFLLLAIL